MKHQALENHKNKFTRWILDHLGYARRHHKRWASRDTRPYWPIPFRKQLDLITPRVTIGFVDEQVILDVMNNWNGYDDMETDEFGNKIWRHQFTGDLVCITYQRGTQEIHELCVYNERDMKELINNG